MDRLTHYKQIMAQLTTKFAELYALDEENVDTVVVVDHPNGVYQLYHIGWDGHTRVRENCTHVRVKNGKFWIEDDWTADGIVTHLKEAGIPNEDIVLAFNPPDMRQYTEYAVV